MLRLTESKHLAALPAMMCLAAMLAACSPADPIAEIRDRQARGEFEDTLEPLRDLIVAEPGDTEVLFMYGRALSVTGRTGQAQWSLREAMVDPRWREAAGLQLAVGALRAGDTQQVVEVTSEILAEDPENLNALILRARAHADSRLDFESALADADRALELDPDSVQAMSPRILALIGLERIPEVAEAMESLGDQIENVDLGFGSLAWYCATLAIFADENGEADLAAERWSDCVTRYPADAHIVEPAVQFYDSRQEYDRTRAVLRAALEAEPSSSFFREALARRLRAEGSVAEAEALLLEAAEQGDLQVSVPAWLALVTHYQEIGDYARAAESARHAVESTAKVGTPQPQSLFVLADALLLAEDFDGAMAAIEASSVGAHRELILGRVWLARGEPRVALEHFDEAFRLWPNNPWARYYAAIAAEAAGDFDRAISEYRYSIRIDPSATDARVRLGRLHAAEGKPVVALQVVRLRVDRSPLDVEGELLSAMLFAWAQQTPQMNKIAEALRARGADVAGRGLVSMARGVHERFGADGALRILTDGQGKRLTQPQYADALKLFVAYAHEAGRANAAELRVGAALKAHPDSARLRAVHAFDLALRGAPQDEVRAAYQRALDVDPTMLQALIGWARHSIARDPAGARAALMTAIEIDPLSVEARRTFAALEVATGQTAEAERQLELLLDEDPYDAAAAIQLARLRLDRGVRDERTRELAARAVRFRGGSAARALMTQLDPAPAAAAASAPPGA